MKTIKFNKEEYKLVYTVFEGAAKLRATIYKENHDIPSVSADVNGCDSIVIKEDGEVTAQYSGFSSLVGIQIFSDYPVNEGTDKVICIDIVNTNIQAQIDALTQHLSTIEQTQEQQAEIITELTPYTETKTAYFNESEKTFYNVPEGNISVFFDNYNGQYSVSRVSDRVIVSFDTLAQATNITISVN